MTREERIKCINSLIMDVKAKRTSNEITPKELSFLSTELRLLILINDLEHWCAEERN